MEVIIGSTIMIRVISKVQHYLGIEDWEIKTELINPNQIEYNGETYFIGIERQWGNKVGIIYHDIPLDIESIIHELLYIKYPQLDNQNYEEYETFICFKTENIHSEFLKILNNG